MVEYNSKNEQLTNTLKALSDTTRRSLLTHLSQNGPCRVTELSTLYEMSLNAVSKHIKVLEKSGLVTRKKIGRVHLIEANLSELEEVVGWMEQLQSIWQLRLNKLSEILEKEPTHE